MQAVVEAAQEWYRLLHAGESAITVTVALNRLMETVKDYNLTGTTAEQSAAANPVSEGG